MSTFDRIGQVAACLNVLGFGGRGLWVTFRDRYRAPRYLCVAATIALVWPWPIAVWRGWPL